MGATVPDRTNSMDDIVAGQIIGLRDFRLAGLTAVQRPALCQKLWPSSPMDGSINTAPPAGSY